MEALGILLILIGIILIIMTWTETTGQVLEILVNGAPPSGD